MRTAKQPRAIKTRDRILRDAAQLFALKGFHDTKVDEIIQAAEVTSGAFFHHFKGKEDLGFAVIDHHMRQRCQALDRIEKGLPLNDNDDPLDQVFRRLDAVVRDGSPPTQQKGRLPDRESQHRAQRHTSGVSPAARRVFRRDGCGVSRSPGRGCRQPRFVG